MATKHEIIITPMTQEELDSLSYNDFADGLRPAGGISIKCSADSEISNLEWRVCEAAVNLVLINKPSTPVTGYYNAYGDLTAAVDALIAAREQKEKAKAS